MTFSKLTNDPTPSTIMPPAVGDDGAVGTVDTMFALANHTHASQVRRAKVTTAANGSYTWTYSPPFAAGVTPSVFGVVESAGGNTDVFDLKLVGSATNTQASILVSRSQASLISLLGITLLQVPAAVGAQTVHLVAVGT